MQPFSSNSESERIISEEIGLFAIIALGGEPCPVFFFF
jgi:hypothetical protein